MENVTLIPSARRLVSSLRDMGYDLSQAVADVIDNSVEAGATQIRVDIEFDGDESWIRIADDGSGMRPEVLREALRFGSEREYGEDALGKFGLGLKTASLSQCQRLTVASRWNPLRADISAYSWDLQHITKENRWEVLPVKRTDAPGIFEILDGAPGTVVLWGQLDRILGYKHPYGEAAKKRLALMCREIESHLAMVLHRFLDGSRKRKIEIYVNSNKVEAWDPFCLSEGTEKLESVWLKVDEDNARGSIHVQPYILPHQSDFSSQAAHKRSAGRNGWNQQQGLYIYRNGRLIQSGGWSHLRAADEHTKLARIAISFSPTLDDAFKVNVAKMRVQIPQSVREELKELTTQVAKRARQVYDRKEQRVRPANVETSQNGGPASARMNASPKPVSRADSHGHTAKSFTFDQWRGMMVAHARPEEKPVVLGVLARVDENLELMGEPR